jgi:hypothetical protein
MSRRASFKLALVALTVLGCVARQNSAPRRGVAVPLPGSPFAVPFDSYLNQVFVEVAVNGAEPQWFIVDSGASSCVVDSAFAARLGLTVEGHKQGTGAGKGTIDVRFVHGITFGLPGGVNLPVDQAYVIDLSGQPAILGRPVFGLLGYELFKHYVVEVDFDTRLLRLYEPATYAYSGKSRPIALSLKKNLPHVTATLMVPGRPPQARELLVDLGSQDAVDDDLVTQSTGPKAEVIGGVGLGEEFRIVVARVDALQLGDFVLRYLPGAGGGGVPLIGSEVLRRFRVIFDYSRGQLILEPNRHLLDAFLTNSSGLDLRWDSEHRRFQVHDVHKDSPAQRAGIKTGDSIVAIDGQSAGSFDLQRLARMFEEDGVQYTLALRRGEQELRVNLALTRQF